MKLMNNWFLIKKDIAKWVTDPSQYLSAPNQHGTSKLSFFRVIALWSRYLPTINQRRHDSVGIYWFITLINPRRLYVSFPGWIPREVAKKKIKPDHSKFKIWYETMVVSMSRKKRDWDTIYKEIVMVYLYSYYSKNVVPPIHTDTFQIIAYKSFTSLLNVVTQLSFSFFFF